MNNSNSGLLKFVSSRSGRIRKIDQSRTSRFGGSAYAGWLGMMRYGPGRFSTASTPTSVTLYRSVRSDRSTAHAAHRIALKGPSRRKTETTQS